MGGKEQLGECGDVEGDERQLWRGGPISLGGN